LEAVILDADGTATGVINDQFGNGVATVSGTGSGASVTWNTTRVGAYGPLPGIQAQTLTDVSQVAAATAWRSRRIDSTGFYWLGARYYEPTSGRFLSCDPLGHAASRSLYDFCNGDPVNFFDPDGRIFGTGLGFGEFFGSVGSGMAQGAGNYFVGLGQGMVGAVNGAQNAILHPVTTFENAANGLGTLAGNLRYNTSDTLSGIGNTITNTVTDSGKLGNAIGNAVGAVAFGELAAGVTEALNGGSELVGQSFGKVGTAVEDPGLSITGFTDHGFMRANTRGLSWDTMADTVADPTVVLQQSGGAYLFLTDDAGVALSSDGMIITTYSPPFYPHIQAILDASAAAEDTIALAQAGTVTGALTIEMTTPSKRCPLSN
jgi:RHS repeat-associated protein